MTVREGNLAFTFGPTWRFLKYDENGSFYRTKLASKLEPTKAVDFICLNIDSNQPLVMIEVKDYSLHDPDRGKDDDLSKTVALKTRDTIAGIVGGSNQVSNSNINDGSFFKDSYRRLRVPPRIFFFYEDMAVPTRQDPRRLLTKRNVKLKQLKEHLGWLTKDIAVIGLNDYKEFINDLTIRRV